MANRFEQMRGIILDNRYKIDKNIGTGGMADVYLGQDLLLERPVALKILHANFADDVAFVTRFKREAQAAGKLNNPHIVNMYDVGIDQGFHYIVMEYVPGTTLKEYIKEKKRLSTDEAVQIALAIGDGLEHAHSMGIVHCDVKPHNILITNQGAIKVTDFGIARAINSSQTTLYTTSVMGSAHYLSPEQASGKQVDVASDIYSLGVVLYEMLTGRVPYEGDSAISVALKHVRETVVKPSVYCPTLLPSLEAVVMKSLQKKPEDRFHSIAEMMAELRRAVNYRGVSHIPAPKAAYDFATQLIPKAEEDSREVKSVLRPEAEKELTGNRFLDFVNRVPPRLFTVGAIVLFLLAFLWAYFSFGNFWSNATVVVPDVVGKQVSVAQNILEDKHLKVTINEVANPDVPAGRVISMNPEAGTEVKENRNIRLVVSKGAGDISLPDLVGLSLEDAKKALNNLGLSIGNVETIEDSSKPEGVVGQSPSAFEKLSKGSSVNLIVNKKAEKSISMPKLVGLTIKDARSILGDLNLSIGSVNGDSDEGAVITDQSPAAGSAVGKGDAVTVAATKKEAEKDKTVSGTVDITVPKGGKAKSVKIVVSDDAGKRTVYEATHNPGDNVVRQVSGAGSVRVQVYINGTLVQDQLL